ncbi:hypothetical protein [Methylosinus sp. PW1]|uniref:hypothetical protein n=1 Tax=Methylosinus sp. PW1 TaxID=107636 RepID=UPI0012EC9705|nr:hypothetical protein [Methylosinus sp. PW1]
MSDDQFVRYCESMTETPRCGATPRQMERLCRLSGHVDWANEWKDAPNGVYDGYKNAIVAMIDTYRSKA